MQQHLFLNRLSSTQQPDFINTASIAVSGTEKWKLEGGEHLHTTKKDHPYQGNSSGTVLAELTQSCHTKSRYKSESHTLQAKCSHRSRGITTVEFAIASSLFFLFMFMVIDFALFGFVKLTMQHAVREGARYAITGQSNLDPEANGDRRRAIIQKIRDDSMGFFDDVMSESDIEVTDSNGVAVAGFGAPGETIVITLRCQWPIINPFTQAMLSQSHYNFSVGASMKNESFPGVAP